MHRAFESETRHIFQRSIIPAVLACIVTLAIGLGAGYWYGSRKINKETADSTTALLNRGQTLLARQNEDFLKIIRLVETFNRVTWKNTDDEKIFAAEIESIKEMLLHRAKEINVVHQ